MTEIAVIGARDRQLEELVRGAGFHPTPAALTELQGLAHTSSRQPSAVVLDLRGEQSVPSAASVIRRNHPRTGIVLVVSSLDPALLVEAMRAGITEVVSEPFSQDDLQKAIGRVSVAQAPREQGQIYGFVGAKGGVGTTTAATNIATILGASSKPRRTLLLDLHPAGGDVALFAGVEPKFSVRDALDNIHRLDNVFLKNIVAAGTPHVDVLASAELPSAGSFTRERVQRLISYMAGAYKHTVIDLPRSEAMILDTLDQLTTICIVANQELATVRSASRLASMLKDRYGADKIMLVLSRSDRQADIGHQDVEKAVGFPISHTFPSDYRLALQALHKGRPLALENHNDLSASFRRFAHRMGGVVSEDRGQKTAGLFGRFKTSRS